MIQNLPYVPLAPYDLEFVCNIEIGSMEMVMVMKPCVLYIEENTSTERLQSLEAAGFGVLNASHELDAIKLLESHRVDVICVASQDEEVQKPGMGRSIKSVRPDVPVVLIRNQVAPPAHFEEYVDIVIDESGFRATAQWLIQALQQAPNVFFVQWFANWMRRSSELKTGESSPIR